VCLGLLEAALHPARNMSEDLRLLLHMPESREDYEGVTTLEGLLDRTIIGHRPLTVRGGFVLNSQGFRTHEYEQRKTPGTHRVCLLGDSFAYDCSGIPQAQFWPVLLEQELNDWRPETVELLNLSMPAVGPAFYQLAWQLAGSTLDADAVIVAFFVGNDFSPQRPVADGPSWLVRTSLLARLVRNVSRVLLAELEVAGELEAPVVTDGKGGYELEGWAETWAKRPPTMSAEELRLIESRRSWIFDDLFQAGFKGVFRRTALILKALADDVASSGASLFVIVIPDRLQIEEQDRQALLQSLGKDAASFDWERPQRELGLFFEREGIVWLDLLPAFRAAGEGAKLYGEGDTHWSPEGSRLAADLIRDALRARPESLGL
jgi:hypothetical protein